MGTLPHGVLDRNLDICLEILLREERLLVTPRAHLGAWILSGILILPGIFFILLGVSFRPGQ